MKILFLGDYSNLHACLAAELRRRGEDVTVVSDGGRFMDTKRDITLERKPGRLGALKYLYSLFSLLPKLSGYDVVQLINPQFFQLRPGKARYFFDRIKDANGSVFCTLAGNDYHFVDACINSDMFKYSEFRIGNIPTEHEQATHRAQGWLRHDMKRYADYVYEKLDGAMSVLPEYDMAARPLLGQRLAFTNIPIDLPHSRLLGWGTMAL